MQLNYYKIIKYAYYSENHNFHSFTISKITKFQKFYFPFFSFSRTYTEGPFQSDALLVPEGCLFDHIHNASRCWPFIRWNQTGGAACQDRGMQMRSFAMLLPCGISLFSGVEFVCCPKHFKGECILRFYEYNFMLSYIQYMLYVRHSSVECAQKEPRS